MTLSEQLKSLAEKADEHAAVLDIIGDFIDDMPHIQKDVGEVADFLSEFVAIAPTILAALEAVDRMGSFGCDPNHNTTKPIKAFGVSLCPTPEKNDAL